MVALIPNRHARKLRLSCDPAPRAVNETGPGPLSDAVQAVVQ